MEELFKKANKRDVLKDREMRFYRNYIYWANTEFATTSVWVDNADNVQMCLGQGIVDGLFEALDEWHQIETKIKKIPVREINPELIGTLTIVLFLSCTYIYSLCRRQRWQKTFSSDIICGNWSFNYATYTVWYRTLLYNSLG